MNIETSSSVTLEPTVDFISLVLSRCDFQTVMRSLATSSAVRAIIMKNRRHFARQLAYDVIIHTYYNEYPFPSACIETEKGWMDVPICSMSIVVPHIKPERLDMRFFSVESDIDDPTLSHIITTLPKEWYSEVRNIAMTYMTPFAPKAYELFKKFRAVDCVRMNGVALFSELGTILKDMRVINQVIMTPGLTGEAYEMTSCDADLKMIEERSEKFTKLKIKHVENTYSTESLISLLMKAKLSCRCDIVLKKWVDDPKKLVNWIKENTDLKLATFRPNGDVHFNSYFAHVYDFDYRDSKVQLSFEENAHNGTVFALNNDFEIEEDNIE